MGGLATRQGAPASGSQLSPRPALPGALPPARWTGDVSKQHKQKQWCQGGFWLSARSVLRKRTRLSCPSCWLSHRPERPGRRPSLSGPCNRCRRDCGRLCTVASAAQQQCVAPWRTGLTANPRRPVAASHGLPSPLALLPESRPHRRPARSCRPGGHPWRGGGLSAWEARTGIHSSRRPGPPCPPRWAEGGSAATVLEGGPGPAPRLQQALHEGQVVWAAPRVLGGGERGAHPRAFGGLHLLGREGRSLRRPGAE